MSKPKSPLWGSISLLIVAVIAVMAFVRGKWELPLLVSIFALWALWAVWQFLIPVMRANRAEKERAPMAEWTPVDETKAVPSSPTLSRLLLLHVNNRISGCLTSYYPNVRWEWEIDDPERFVTEGGTGRIRVYGVPDYAYADVTLDQKANIDIVLLNLAPLAGKETGKPGRQPLNPQVWFETQGKETLERMVMELNSRGHNTLYVKENGAICCQKDGGDETPEGMFQNFPNKVYWPSLVEVLRQNGLAASALDHCIQVAW